MMGTLYGRLAFWGLLNGTLLESEDSVVVHIHTSMWIPPPPMKRTKRYVEDWEVE